MPKPTKAQLQEQLQQEQWQSTLLMERILELEQDDLGWQHITEGFGEFDFSRQFLGQIVKLSRVMALKNPLIRRYVRLQANYVWGQGVNITAADEPVNQAIHDLFWGLPSNLKELTGPQAVKAKDREYSIVGNLFLALFSDPSTGAVTVRGIPFEEVQEVITDPDDCRTVWYYKRVWTEHRFNQSNGQTRTKVITAWYPDWRYMPRAKPQSIGGHEVRWNAPVYHAKDVETSDMKWGVPSTYAALDWAKAVKSNLEDHATLVKALARFAWHFPADSRRGVTNLKGILGTTLGDTVGGAPETNPPPVAGAAWLGPNAPQPIRTAGASPHPDESRRLWLMVAAAVGIPETILAGDADVGNLATAKTLDRPTELQMVDRQTTWKEILGDIISYSIDQIRKAPNGPLPAIPATGADSLDTHVDIDFPQLLERDLMNVVDAISKAHATGRLTPEMVSRLLMEALGIDDIDEELEKIAQMDDENEQKAAEIAGQGLMQGQQEPPEGEETEEEREARVGRTLRQIDDVLRGVTVNGHR